MTDASASVRRLCVAVDVDDGGPDPLGSGHSLPHLVARASSATGLDRLCMQQDAEAGGGLLLLLPPGVDEAKVIGDLLGELRAVLWRHNRHAGASGRIRLRLAFHQGLTRIGEVGFVGRAVDTVRRLCSCAELRRELIRHPDADLAAILSEQLFDDVIEHERHGLRRCSFRAVDVREDGCTRRAWIHVQGVRGDAVPAPRRGESPDGRLVT
ncbi:hypothetical protein [Rhizohabitans arisaemae]|uniref:hypothetical protein n=1 Tax=Rhizohabitans arisaemae TaxID=2720610 RepID=UPI0024B0621A|nr:hypothetical protein [Rhizohabitans arisaemae]